MRKVAILGSLCLLLAGTACGRDIELPQVVKDALEKRFPGAKIREVDIDKYKPNGSRRTVLTYEIVCRLPDREIEVLVTESGEVLLEEFSIKPRGGRDIQLAREEIEEDLAHFQRGLEERFAYYEANGVDIGKLLGRTRKAAKKGMPRRAFAFILHTAMAQFIDGHARVSDVPSGERGRLPFLVEAIGEKYVAFLPDRSGFVADGYPWIEKLDGLAMDEWVDKLGLVISEGSRQHRTRQTMRWLRKLPLCRQLAEIKAKGDVKVVLRSTNGKRTKKLTLPLGRHSPIYGPWPSLINGARPRVLDGNIGYLPIADMDGRRADLVREWLPKFKDTNGLIVDVRCNGGGSREVLLELYPRLMEADESPRIVSVAKYRLWKGFEDNHLDHRFMRRADDARLNAAEQAAAREFLASFKPEWEPPAAKFSAWHVLVMSPAAERYEKPVVILMDDRCFSATDIFLGAFKGRPNVTLMGRPSGGGSAFSQRFSLPRSGLVVKCASMASFMPDGKLYDRHGVQPDVVIDVAPEYFLTKGGSDEMLERALAHLKKG